MSLVADIARTYRAPRAVVRSRMAGATEARALRLLVAGCLLAMITGTPVIMANGVGSFADRLIGTFVAWGFIAPLFLYLLAALGGLIARAFAGRANWLGARMALFWAFVAVMPLWLLNGLAVGFLGQGAAISIILGVLSLIAPVLFWVAGLVETHSSAAEPAHV